MTKTLCIACVFLWVSSSCGARSALPLPIGETSSDAGFDGNIADSGNPVDAAPDAPAPIDTDCPAAPAPGGDCDLPADPGPTPSSISVCFYAGTSGFVSCRCEQGQWACAPTTCSGWGGECTASIKSGSCSAGLGCGACCSVEGQPALATWCDCTGSVGAPPFCTFDQVCVGP